MKAKYRHWLELADVTMLYTDVMLLQLQSTHPCMFATALHNGVMLHVYPNFKKAVGELFEIIVKNENTIMGNNRGLRKIRNKFKGD